MEQHIPMNIKHHLNARHVLFDFIYTILLMLREKTKEAEEKILKLLEDSSISTYTLTLARLDVSLAKKILPDSRELDKIEEILNDRIKSSKV